MMRQWRRIYLTATLLLVLCSSSCTQLLGGGAKIRERRKFIIEAEPLRLNLPASERPYQSTVQIDKFSISPLYERNQIIFRLTPEEIEDDNYNQWAVRPGDMITDAVAGYVRRAGLFTDVREVFYNTEPDFTLTGTVNAIERFDSGDRWFARLDVTIQLVGREEQIFWQHRFDPNEIEVYDSDMVFTVQALRSLLRQNMEGAMKSLDLDLLIRKVTLDGRDPTDLIHGNTNGNGISDAVQDSTEIPLETEHYRIFPGKLAPEDP